MERIGKLLLILTLAALLGGCCMSHQWQEADCLKPKTCVKCGETEGEALGHSWREADCVTPKTCTLCDLTEGEPLGHSWQEADCVTPKTCTLCAAAEGEALGHDPVVTKMYARSYEGFCGTCDAALTETVTEEQWNTVAVTEVLGKWYAALAKYDEKYYYVRTEEVNEVSVDFREDGSVRMIIGTSYDRTGTWKFSNLLSANDGTMVMVYYLTMPDGRYTYSLQAMGKDNYKDFPEVTIPAGYTVFSHPDGTGIPFAVYTRQKY